MMLSDKDIRVHLQSEDPDLKLVVKPLNQQDIQPASIDLHLGNLVLLDTERRLPFERMDNGMYVWDLETDGPLTVVPGDFLLAPTLEWIEVPARLAGQMIGKSSRAREGWVIESAGFFDPGWKGRGTMEISQRRWRGGILTAGMPICQMRFFALTSTPQFLYGDKVLQSHYNFSEEAETSYSDPLIGRATPA